MGGSRIRTEGKAISALRRIYMKVMVETSARHAHISQSDLEILFGKGAQLTQKRELSQPGQYVCEEKIEAVGPKGSLKMTILGPTRPETQLELSLTDARKLGISVPIRESGDLPGSAGCILRGPAGEIEIKQGVIAAKRHVHMQPKDAEKVGISDKQIVSVKVSYGGRETIFGDVLCRVNPAYGLSMHVDTDEANAAALPTDAQGEIIV